MARIRTVKPELAAHEGLFDLELETGLPIRFAWCMLFTVADREGRFQWRPRTLKAQILPHDDIDFSRVLDAWTTRGFIRKYRVGTDWYGVIPTFQRHQVINNREAASELPSIDDADEVIQPVANASATRDSRDDDALTTRVVHALGEGRKEGKGTAREARVDSPHSENGKAKELELHDSLPRDAWDAWLAYRREQRLTLSHRALALHLKRLVPYDTDTQRDMLETAMQAGWSGVFPPKGQKSKPPASGPATTLEGIKWE